MQIEGRYRILLIRHGKTEGNRERRYNGCRTDEVLCPEGREELLQRRLPGDGADHIFSGPMKRCRETAACLYPGRAPEILPEMKEVDFGRFEGKNHQELDGDPEYQAWIDSGGRTGFPEGEGAEEFTDRSMRAFRDMLHRLPKDTEEVVSAALVCHGGNIMAIMSSLTGGNFFDFQAKNGEGYELTFSMRGEDIYDLSYHSLYSGESSGSDHR